MECCAEENRERRDRPGKMRNRRRASRTAPAAHIRLPLFGPLSTPAIPQAHHSTLLAPFFTFKPQHHTPTNPTLILVLRPQRLHPRQRCALCPPTIEQCRHCVTGRCHTKRYVFSCPIMGAKTTKKCWHANMCIRLTEAAQATAKARAA